jgi:hypothetical protein
MKKEISDKKRALQAITFIISLIAQIMWAIIIFNYGELLIGRSFAIVDMIITFQEIAFYEQLVLLCIAIVLLLIAERNMKKWEMYALLFLELFELGLIGHFVYRWVTHAWIKRPPNTFGLGYLVGMVLVVGIPLTIQIWIVIRKRSLLFGKKGDKGTVLLTTHTP